MWPLSQLLAGVGVACPLRDPPTARPVPGEGPHPTDGLRVCASPSRGDAGLSPPPTVPAPQGPVLLQRLPGARAPPTCHDQLKR